MKISALKVQAKNAQRVSVFVDDKYSFSLSLDELIKYKLKRGDEVSMADVKRFKKTSADGKLRARALEWLLNRPHSEKEFRDYLYRRRAEPEQTDSLVAEFSERGYLDDSKFAAWYVELLTRRGKSDRVIKSELFSKGINRELVEAALSQTQDKEEARLKVLVDKKASLPRYQKDPEKLITYLVGQGFSYRLVKQLLAIREPED